jgi:hypothetical protein
VIQKMKDDAVMHEGRVDAMKKDLGLVGSWKTGGRCRHRWPRANLAGDDLL